MKKIGTTRCRRRCANVRFEQPLCTCVRPVILPQRHAPLGKQRRARRGIVPSCHPAILPSCPPHASHIPVTPRIIFYGTLVQRTITPPCTPFCCGSAPTVLDGVLDRRHGVASFASSVREKIRSSTAATAARRACWRAWVYRLVVERPRFSWPNREPMMV